MSPAYRLAAIAHANGGNPFVSLLAARSVLFVRVVLPQLAHLQGRAHHTTRLHGLALPCHIALFRFGRAVRAIGQIVQERRHLRDFTIDEIAGSRACRTLLEFAVKDVDKPVNQQPAFARRLCQWALFDVLPKGIGSTTADQLLVLIDLEVGAPGGLPSTLAAGDGCLFIRGVRDDVSAARAGGPALVRLGGEQNATAAL